LGWFGPENRHFVLFSAVGYNIKKNLSAVGYSAKKTVRTCMYQLQNFISQKLKKLFERKFQRVFYIHILLAQRI
jgi:hypothetical protein